MPNHYTVMAICSPGYEFKLDEFNAARAKSNFCEIVRPMPAEIQATDGQPGLNPPWLVWARENWGTKWGTYDARAFELGGDNSPVLIKFQCAWSPPNVLTAIAQWLMEQYGFEQVAWVGFDPYDATVSMLGQPPEPIPTTHSALEACPADLADWEHADVVEHAANWEAE